MCSHILCSPRALNYPTTTYYAFWLMIAGYHQVPSPLSSSWRSRTTIQLLLWMILARSSQVSIAIRLSIRVTSCLSNLYTNPAGESNGAQDTCDFINLRLSNPVCRHELLIAWFALCLNVCVCVLVYTYLCLYPFHYFSFQTVWIRGQTISRSFWENVCLSYVNKTTAYSPLK